MNTEYFTEMHKLIERAKALEKMGREEDALNTYLEIHARFFPNTSDLYERPAILLEKRKRFDEAIAICEKAVKLIGEGKITGIKDNFVRRIDRIKSRSEGRKSLEPEKPANGKVEAPHKTEVKTKTEPSKFEATRTEATKTENTKVESAYRAETNNYREAPAPRRPFETKQEKRARFTLLRRDVDRPDGEAQVKKRFKLKRLPIHFKQPNFRKLLQQFLKLLKAFIVGLKNFEIKAIFVLCLIMASIFGFFFFMSQFNTDRYDMFLKLSEYKNNGAEAVPLTKEELAKLPIITPDMIVIARQSLSQMPAVRDAGVVVHEDMLGLVIKLNPGASQAEAKTAAETFVRALASAAAEPDHLRGPNSLSYGELYNYYGAVVVVGEDPKNVALTGYKFSRALGFTWKAAGQE